jgi:hypothetical protein
LTPTVLNVLLRSVPITMKEAIAATAIDAAINVYSIAVGQVRWLLDKCDWGAVAAGALRVAKSLSVSSRIALS